MFSTPRDPKKRLTTQAYDNFLLTRERELKGLRELGFSKHIHGYSLRYSILAKAHKKLKPKNYEMFAGHSMETGLKYYAHLDTDDLKEDLDANFYEVKENGTIKEHEYEIRIKQLEKQLAFFGRKVNEWAREKNLPNIF
jgi:hypothetical protein